MATVFSWVREGLNIVIISRNIAHAGDGLRGEGHGSTMIMK